jgi:hypothetical protein
MAKNGHFRAQISYRVKKREKMGEREIFFFIISIFRHIGIGPVKIG